MGNWGKMCFSVFTQSKSIQVLAEFCATRIDMWKELLKCVILRFSCITNKRFFFLLHYHTWVVVNTMDEINWQYKTHFKNFMMWNTLSALGVKQLCSNFIIFCFSVWRGEKSMMWRRLRRCQFLVSAKRSSWTCTVYSESFLLQLSCVNTRLITQLFSLNNSHKKHERNCIEARLRNGFKRKA